MTNENKIDQEPQRTARSRTGVVVRDKMMKTRVVEVTRIVAHPVYGKTMRLKTRYKAHDERNETVAGDKVRMIESRPISRDKRWRIIEVLKD